MKILIAFLMAFQPVIVFAGNSEKPWGDSPTIKVKVSGEDVEYAAIELTDASIRVWHCSDYFENCVVFGRHDGYDRQVIEMALEGVEANQYTSEGGMYFGGFLAFACFAMSAETFGNRFFKPNTPYKSAAVATLATSGALAALCGIAGKKFGDALAKYNHFEGIRTVFDSEGTKENIVALRYASVPAFTQQLVNSLEYLSGSYQ